MIDVETAASSVRSLSHPLKESFAADFLSELPVYGSFSGRLVFRTRVASPGPGRRDIKLGRGLGRPRSARAGLAEGGVAGGDALEPAFADAGGRGGEANRRGVDQPGYTPLFRQISLTILQLHGKSDFLSLVNHEREGGRMCGVLGSVLTQASDVSLSLLPRSS